MTPVTIPNRHPRNPFVAAAMRRKAGAHRDRRATERQRAQRELRRELRFEHPPQT